MVKKGWNKIEVSFTLLGFFFLVVIISAVLYSLFFLSTKMITALSVDEVKDEEIIFDIDKFNKLGI